MLFMVIEHFKPGNIARIGERFARNGRMLPEGVTYHASWVESSGDRGFQIMDAENRETLQTWATPWADLIEFEIIPVELSVDFWARARSY